MTGEKKSARSTSTVGRTDGVLVRGLLVMTATAVGCGEEAPPIECSDPLGGELHGVFTPSTEPPITLGTVDPTPRMIHIDATDDHPSGTYLEIFANGVYFNVVLSGEWLETTAVADMRYVGDGTVAIINSCPSRVPSEYRRVTGTVAMTFNGEPIDGWFNGWFQPWHP